MESTNSEELRYIQAKKRVKRIKGFYTHFFIYICVNALIIYLNYRGLEAGETYFQWHNFITLLFWGIGLMAHGLSVFLPNFFLGNDWEERKIRELMDKYK